MTVARNAPIIERCPANPILTKDDIPYPVETVHNAGVTRYDGRTIMLFRSHLRNGRSIIGIAESEDGFKFIVGPKPFLIPSTEGAFGEYEAYGVEDPRISCIDGEYLITYSAYSRHGVRIALAKTRDFRSIERVALITQADMLSSSSRKNSMVVTPVWIAPIRRSAPGPYGCHGHQTWCTGVIPRW